MTKVSKYISSAQKRTKNNHLPVRADYEAHSANEATIAAVSDDVATKTATATHVIATPPKTPWSTVEAAAEAATHSAAVLLMQSNVEAATCALLPERQKWCCYL